MRLTVLVLVVALGLGLSAAEGEAPRAVRQVSVTSGARLFLPSGR